METEVKNPIELNISEPLRDVFSFKIEQQFTLNDAPLIPVSSICAEHKPLILIDYIPSSFGQVICGLQKIH